MLKWYKKTRQTPFSFSPSSYRPISLLPACSKILGKLLLNRILPIMEEHSTLPNHQFCFRSHHSSIHLLHSVVDILATALENELDACGLFFDINQVFPKVWNHGLLSKLRFLPSKFYHTLHSFLSDRFFLRFPGSCYI